MTIDYALNVTDTCRVWRARPSLLDALPPPDGLPGTIYEYGADIDMTTWRQLDVMVFRSCKWHTDWSKCFEMVIVQGTGRIHVGHEHGHAESSECDKPKRVFSAPIGRGDVIQLWGMAPHRASTRSYMHAICLPQGREQYKFLAPARTEQRLARVIQRSAEEVARLSRLPQATCIPSAAP
jgi:hypothetical protein